VWAMLVVSTKWFPVISMDICAPLRICFEAPGGKNKRWEFEVSSVLADCPLR